jgi:hypothetical protein
MDRNRYTPPAAPVADPDDGVGTLQIDLPARRVWIRRFALFFAVIGIASELSSLSPLFTLAHLMVRRHRSSCPE